jgi:antitoxin VapB
MQTAKLFTNGNSQAVRLPKEFRFKGTEVGIRKMGKNVILYSKEDAEELFYSSLGKFTDDFFEAVESIRKNPTPDSIREEL